MQLKAQSPPPQGLPSSNDGQSHTQSNDSCTLGECRSRCIEQLKTATRRYARKQRRWIINRLVPCQSECFRLYRLNASSISDWEQTVLAPALQICGPLCAAGENCDILPSNTFNHLVEALPAVPGLGAASEKKVIALSTLALIMSENGNTLSLFPLFLPCVRYTSTVILLCLRRMV